MAAKKGNVIAHHVGMESGLLKNTHLLPQRAVHGDHRAAEDRSHPIKILGVVRTVGLQHMLEMLGLGEQEHALRPHLERYATVVMARHLQQQSERISRIMKRGKLGPDSVCVAFGLDLVLGNIGDCVEGDFLPRHSDFPSDPYALCLSGWTNRYIVPADGSVIHVTRGRGCPLLSDACVPATPRPFVHQDEREVVEG
jgi:hypothetical protein